MKSVCVCLKMCYLSVCLSDVMYFPFADEIKKMHCSDFL